MALSVTSQSLILALGLRQVTWHPIKMVMIIALLSRILMSSN